MFSPKKYQRKQVLYQPRIGGRERKIYPQGYIKRMWAEVFDQEMRCFILVPIDGDTLLVSGDGKI